DAGLPAALWNHLSLPVAVQSGSAVRSAGIGGTEGNGAVGFAAAHGLQRADAVGRPCVARGRGSARNRRSGTGTGARGRAGKRRQRLNLQRHLFRLILAIIRNARPRFAAAEVLVFDTPRAYFRRKLGPAAGPFGGLQDGFA